MGSSSGSPSGRGRLAGISLCGVRFPCRLLAFQTAVLQQIDQSEEPEGGNVEPFVHGLIRCGLHRRQNHRIVGIVEIDILQCATGEAARVEGLLRARRDPPRSWPADPSPDDSASADRRWPAPDQRPSAAPASIPSRKEGPSTRRRMTASSGQIADHFIELRRFDLLPWRHDLIHEETGPQQQEGDQQKRRRFPTGGISPGRKPCVAAAKDQHGERGLDEDPDSADPVDADQEKIGVEDEDEGQKHRAQAVEEGGEAGLQRGRRATPPLRQRRRAPQGASHPP